MAGKLLETMLYVLVGNAPAAVGADELANALWGDSLPRTWEASLRVHIGRLRALLAHSGFEVRNDVRAGYSLHGPSQASDVGRFTELGRVLSAQSNASERLETIEFGLELWRSGTDHLDAMEVVQSFVGPLLQQHTAFELERYRLLIELGRQETVVHELSERAASDPLDEGIVVPLVEALSGLGRWTEAQACVTRTRSALQAVGLEASVSLHALQRRIFATRLAEEPRRVKRVVSEGVAAFVGRTAERERCLELVESGCRVILITGDSGMGKSRFLNQLCIELQKQGHSVTSARTVEQSAPGGVFRSLLHAWSASALGDEIGLLEATELYLESSEHGRPVIVLDDIHLADLASTKLLRRLFNGPSATEAVVVMSAVPGPWRPFVRDLLSELILGDYATELSLAPLSLDETFGLVRDRTGSSGPHAWSVATMVHQLSGGVPLLIDLTLTQPLPDPLASPVTRATVGAGPLIQSVGLSLSESERSVIGTAALIGSEVDPSLVAEVTEVSLARVLDALSRGQDLGVIRFETRNRAWFRNELVRLSLPSSFPVSWQCDRHRAIARALQRRGASSTLCGMHLACALSASESGVDIDTVLDLVEPGLLEARFDAVLISLEHVREQLQLQPWLFSPQQRVRTLHLLGLAADGALDGETARTYFRDAFEGAVELSDIVTMAHIAVSASGSSQPITGDPEQVGWLRAVAERRAELEPFVRLQILAELTYLLALAGVDANVVDLSVELRELSEVIDTPAARAYAQHGVLAMKVSENDAEGCMEILAFPPRHAPVPAEVLGTALLAGIGAHLSLGDLSEAISLFARLESLAMQRGRPGDRWIVIAIRSFLLEWQGEAERGIAESTKAFQFAERHGVHGAASTWFLALACRCLRDDDWSSWGEPDREPRVGEMAIEHGLRCVGIAATDDLRGLDDDLGALVRRLTTEPRTMDWLGALCLAAEASVRSSRSMNDEIFTLLLPFSGTIVVIGLVPAGTFGPVDRFLAALIAESDPDRSAAFLVRAESMVQRAQLVGWDSEIVRRR